MYKFIIATHTWPISYKRSVISYRRNAPYHRLPIVPAIQPDAVRKTVPCDCGLSIPTVAHTSVATGEISRFSASLFIRISLSRQCVRRYRNISGQQRGCVSFAHTACFVLLLLRCFDMRLGPAFQVKTVPTAAVNCREESSAGYDSAVLWMAAKAALGVAPPRRKLGILSLLFRRGRRPSRI